MPWYVTLSIALGVLSIPSLIKGWLDLPRRVHIGERGRHLCSVFGIVVAVAAIVIAIGGQVCWFNHGKPEIKITSPLGDTSVVQEITVKGYATRELSSEHHLYIVVEYGGRWWPQYSEVSIGFSQATNRYEFNTPARIGQEADIGKTFIIRAILVDSTIHLHFQGWFQQYTLVEEWPGIPITEVNQRGKAEICDSITVMRR